MYHRNSPIYVRCCAASSDSTTSKNRMHEAFDICIAHETFGKYERAVHLT